MTLVFLDNLKNSFSDPLTNLSNKPEQFEQRTNQGSFLGSFFKIQRAISEEGFE